MLSSVGRLARVNGPLCQESVLLPDMHDDMSTETKEQVVARLRGRHPAAVPEHKRKLSDPAVLVGLPVGSSERGDASIA